MVLGTVKKRHSLRHHLQEIRKSTAQCHRKYKKPRDYDGAARMIWYEFDPAPDYYPSSQHVPNLCTVKRGSYVPFRAWNALYCPQGLSFGVMA